MKSFRSCILFLFSIIFSLITSDVKALVAGDNCDSAILINVGATCIPQNYSTTGATNSGAPLPTCGSFTGGDIWFKVVVPISGHLQIQLLGLSGYSPTWAVYSGACGSLTELRCNSGNTLYNINSGSLGGQTLFIRVWRAGNTTPANFSLCAIETNPPLNDSCANAMPIVVNSACLFSTYNNIGCTSEPLSVAPNPTCGAYQGADVWFSVVIPASGHLRIQKSNVSGISARSAIYSGTCGAFTQLACLGVNEPYNFHNHAMAGDTLYIRVWDFGNPFTGGTFNLCATEPNLGENDFCSSATQLNVDSVCVSATFSSLGNTSESATICPNPSCGIYQGGDSWFKVVIPNSGHLRIEKTSIGSSSTYSAIYSGSCGNFTELACLGNGQDYNFHNHAMAGQTLYIRVWEFNNTFPSGSFSLCAWEPSIPEHDFCSNAVLLPVGSSCTMQQFSSLGCTSEPSSVAANASCGFYAGGDSWFKFVVPNSGHLRLEKTNGAGMNTQYALYTGTCGAFTEYACLNGQASYNLHNHALGGQTMYLRVWNFNSAYDGGTFNLCLWEPNTAENDFCVNAIPLTVDSICTNVNINLVGCSSEATSVAANPTCGFYQGGDIWYKCTMPASGHLRIEHSSNININAQFAVYQGSCGSFTLLQCVQSNDALNIHNHNLAGQEIYLRIWDFNYAYPGGNLSICVWEPNTLENDSCEHAVILTLGTTCSMSTYNMIGSTSDPTSVVANPTCGAYNGEDIWYKFLMPASGLLTIQYTNVGAMNTQFALYQGSCGAFTQVACNQSQNPYNLNNIALAGQMLYLRIWDFGVPDGSIFNLCVYDPSCLIVLDSVSTNQTSCSLNNDGSIEVFASCAYCIGNLEYALNNGSYQSSSIFNNLGVNSYLVKVRDSGRPSCFMQSPTNTFIGADTSAHTYFEDLDGDNFGKINVHITTCSAPPPNYVIYSGDCNDTNNTIYPGALEIGCNGIDENCNGLIDDTPGEINLKGNCISILDGDMNIDASGGDGTSFGKLTLGESNFHFFRIENTENLPVIIQSAFISGIDSSQFSIYNISSFDTIPSMGSIDFGVEFYPTSLGVKQAVLTILSTDCDEAVYNVAISGEATLNTFSSLDLRLFIEGYYIGPGLMNSVLSNQGLEACYDICDSIVVELHDTSNYSTIASTKALLRVDGYASCRFESVSGFYYVAIKHRNGLLTWSEHPIEIEASNSVYYDFTTDVQSAFGNNMKVVSIGEYAFYSGDINQDENIDLIDLGLLDSDVQNFESGYRSADMNGDGNVDLLDIPIVELNVNDFIYSIHP